MKKMRFLCLLSIAAILSACSDFLDVKPMGKLIPTEVEEYENLLNNKTTVNSYYQNQNNFYMSGLTDNFSISENSAKYSFGSGDVLLSNYAAYTFQKPYKDPATTDFFWEDGTYKAAGIFNHIIDGIEDVRTAQNSEIADQLIAQAKAARAWGYLTMCMIYGPVYDPASDNSTKTIPYRTASVPLVANPDRATTAEAFALAKKDIEDALQFAPEMVANPCRFSLPAVQALMAYYYMFTRDWQNMLKYADMAWNASLAQKGGAEHMIYNYNNFSYGVNEEKREEGSPDPEVSLEIQGEDDALKLSYARENLLFRTAPTGGTFNNICPSEEFLNLFDREKDLRYKLFALKNWGYSTKLSDGTEYSDGLVTMWYRSDKMWANQGFTYPELLLMRAEAYARTGDKTNALADLNTLRKYRYSGPDTDLPGGTDLSQDALLHEILNERRRELPIATFQRVLDLKRLSLDEGKPWQKTEIEHRVGAKVYSAKINSDVFVLPIPNTVIALNPQWGLTMDERDFDPER